MAGEIYKEMAESPGAIEHLLFSGVVGRLEKQIVLDRPFTVLYGKNRVLVNETTRAVVENLGGVSVRGDRFYHGTTEPYGLDELLYDLCIGLHGELTRQDQKIEMPEQTSVDDLFMWMKLHLPKNHKKPWMMGIANYDQIFAGTRGVLANLMIRLPDCNLFVTWPVKECTDFRLIKDWVNAWDVTLKDEDLLHAFKINDLSFRSSSTLTIDRLCIGDIHLAAHLIATANKLQTNDERRLITPDFLPLVKNNFMKHLSTPLADEYAVNLGEVNYGALAEILSLVRVWNANQLRDLLNIVFPTIHYPWTQAKALWVTHSLDQMIEWVNDEYGYRLTEDWRYPVRRALEIHQPQKVEKINELLAAAGL
jgi:hypothetical protein